MLDLLIDGVEDPIAKENYIKLTELFNGNPWMNGNWKFYEVEITAFSANFKHPHLLGFRPTDAILTGITNGATAIFNYDNFDKDDVELNISGNCTIRFMIGGVNI